MRDDTARPGGDDLEELVREAVAQLDDLVSAGEVEMEAWASGLLALVDELAHEGAAEGPDAGGRFEALVDRVLERLEGAGAAGRRAGRAVRLLAGRRLDAASPVRIVGALEVRSGADLGVGLVCESDDDDRHLVLVDLVRPPDGAAGGGETVGEVVVAGPEALDAARDDPALEVVPVADDAVPSLLERVAVAVARTTDPPESLVLDGRLLLRRLGEAGRGVRPPRVRPPETALPAPRDPDDDAYARSVLTAALGVPATPDPDELARAATAVRRAVTAPSDAADDLVAAFWTAAGLGPVPAGRAGWAETAGEVGAADELMTVAGVVVGAVAPVDLGPLPPAARDAVTILEWADWLGAVIETVRRGPGAPLAGDALVDAVNRCPEVTTTIPRRDRARLAWAFGIVTAPWARAGLADGGALTPLGAVLLPRALDLAWGRPMGSPPAETTGGDPGYPD